MKQEDGRYTFRELLQGVYVLNDGFSMVWAMWVALPSDLLTPLCRTSLGTLLQDLSERSARGVARLSFMLFAGINDRTICVRRVVTKRSLTSGQTQIFCFVHMCISFVGFLEKCIDFSGPMSVPPVIPYP